MSELPTTERKSYRVRFSAVGRGKKSWSSTVSEFPSDADLAKLVRKSKALGSNDIECVFDDESLEYGTVFVGGLRAVGAFKVEEIFS